ncbi:hypothetical protein BST63_06005 [Bradyrhizobium canariense]|uniref:Transposase n=1 Tax=Bradyrhizobium canariense TaxID=255045 RepID=A0ABX3X8K0_9BRAD|nr:hypothetical protein BSR47_07240 [Bradyrhizobium canariense]OSJ33133.1 hypothetical protein BST63_06005 [Bradyrhizobium canariense]
MVKANCLTVRAYGRQLDQLRAEASRIAQVNKIDWWIERADKGTRFCFEDAEATKSFALVCQSFAVPCLPRAAI